MAGREVARGDVYLHQFGRPDKRRPVVVLSRDGTLASLRTATVAPVTTTIRGIASEVALGVDDGFKQACVVNLDHIHTIPQRELVRWIATLDAQRMDEVCAAVHIALGC